MASKLDLLAQKEEQIRLLNEQLDQKKEGLLSGNNYEEDKESDEYAQSPGKDEESPEEYDQDGFEESHNKQNTIAALMQLG